MLHGVRAASSFLSLMPLSLSLSLLLCAQLRYIYAYRGSKTHRDVKSRERAFSSSLCFVITAAPLFNLTATYLHLLYSCLNFLLAICAGERRSARASLSFYSRACTGEHGNSSSHQELAGRKKFCLCFGRRDAECALCLVPVDRFAFKLFFSARLAYNNGNFSRGADFTNFNYIFRFIHMQLCSRYMSSRFYYIWSSLFLS